MSSRTARGFTLLELLIAIAIIGILAIIALNVFSNTGAKARAAVMANAFQQIEKGLRYKAIIDGRSEWWTEDELCPGCGNNPTYEQLVENTDIQRYLQELPEFESISPTWSYDSDGDDFEECGATSYGGVNIAIDNIGEYFDILDETIDGSDGQCGKLRRDTGANSDNIIYYLSDDVGSL